jgi:hypothetical protein
MLTCHPAIVIPPECGFAQWLHAAWGGWGPADTRSPERVSAFVGALTATRKWETWRLPPAAVVDGIEAEQPASYADLVSCVYRSYARAQGKPDARWGDKNNYYLHHVAELRGLFPDSVLVHIVRDGRDVACSYLELSARTMDSPYSPRLPSELDAIAREWSDNVTRIDDALATLGGTTVTIRYEDLVRDPATTLGAALATFGERFHPDMLRYPERNVREQLEPAAFLQWKARTTQGPDDERIGRHLRDLTPAQVARLEHGMRPVLERHGYLPETG